MTDPNSRLDIIEPGDRAALVCIDQADLCAIIVRQLDLAGYKIHTASPGDDLLVKMHGHSYEVVVTWEHLAGRTAEDNPVIIEAANHSMGLRRRQFYVLLGPNLDTGSEMLAFRHSVDLVVHVNDARNLQTLLRHGLARHAQRYSRYTEVVDGVGRE